MKTKFFILLCLVFASFGTTFAAITVRLDPQSCSNWDDVYLYYWGGNTQSGPSWPGITISPDSVGWYSYTFEENVTLVNIIWTNGWGDQTVDIEDVSESTCYSLDSTEGRYITVTIVDCPTIESDPDPEPTPTSGTCGENATWSLDTITGTLTISGTGVMSDYPSPWWGMGDSYSPWRYWNGIIAKVIVQKGITTIGDCAFYGCNLSSVTLPNSLTTIKIAAFARCSNLDSVSLPNSVSSIYDMAFTGCSGLTSITLSNQLTYINIDVFAGCGLTSVNIPNGITEIDKGAFSGCTRLKNVTFPTSLRVIEDGAIGGWDSISSVTCYSVRPPSVIENHYYYQWPYSKVLYVPAESLNTYQMHDFWGRFDVRPLENSALDDISEETSALPQKFFHNGLLYILLPDGTRYTATGQKQE